MEIYNLNSEIFNNALNKKDKKIINVFLKLPNTIKKKNCDRFRRYKFINVFY